MKKWHLIIDDRELVCDVISANMFMNRLNISVNGTFSTLSFYDRDEYNQAKEGFLTDVWLVEGDEPPFKAQVIFK